MRKAGVKNRKPNGNAPQHRLSASEIINRTWEEYKDCWEGFVRKQRFVDTFLDAGYDISRAQRALRSAGDHGAIAWFKGKKKSKKDKPQQYYRRNRVVTEDDLRQ